MSNSPEKPNRGLFETLYDTLSKSLSKNLYQQVVSASSLRPAWTLSKVIAYAFATMIHGSVPIFATLGILVIARNGLNLFSAVTALVCFALVWFFFPRVSKLHGEILPQSQFPGLYQIADRIAKALDSSSPDGIVIDWRYNAGFSRVGWTQKRIVYLGLPLFWVMDGQERVAILGHELAHGVNGDPARGFYLGSAIGTLARWHGILSSASAETHETYGIIDFIVLISEMIAAFLLHLLAAIPWLGAFVLSHLFWRESQRAEYLADYLGATVSGSDAIISALAKMQRNDDVFIQVVQRAALGHDRRDLFQVLREQIPPTLGWDGKAVSPEDDQARIDATHPPTSYRVGFLRAQRVAGAKVIVSDGQWQQVERELVPLQKDIQEKLFDMYRGSLYY